MNLFCCVYLTSFRLYQGQRRHHTTTSLKIPKNPRQNKAIPTYKWKVFRCNFYGCELCGSQPFYVVFVLMLIISAVQKNT